MQALSVTDMRTSISIKLESLLPDHAVEMFAGLSHIEAYRFIPEMPPTNLTNLYERYVRLASGQSADGSEIWMNWIARSQTPEMLALGYTQATITQSLATIAYHVFPNYWNQGVGTLAVHLTLEELFARDDIEQVQALVDTRNLFSISLLKRLGFENTKFIKNADYFKSTSSDEFVFSVNRLVWKSRLSTLETPI